MDKPHSKFFVSDNGKDKVTLAKAELQAGIDSGKHTSETLVWTKGMTDWLPLSDSQWEKHGIRIQPEPKASQPSVPEAKQIQVSESPQSPARSGISKVQIGMLCLGIMLVLSVIGGLLNSFFGNGGTHDLDDPETVDELIPKAVYENSLRYRRKAADGLYGDGTKGETIGRQAYTNTTAYLDESPFTGWMKKVWDNGEIRHLSQFKNGKQDGPSFSWYENGQKSEESYWTAGKYNGTHTIWNIEGTVIKRETWNNGYYDYEAVNELNQRQLLRGDQ